ncbi:Ubiquitin-like superfamily protein [Zea mays]|uniref:Ubiquitin-like superfamily protein n=1 Tax=Zea mays TaxID=4577 RepID=A0A1D6G249_MAIZE|nr:Ubiquitin-like superfamily protein [Zea mays]
MAEAPTYQILVRLLDGRTTCLRFSTPTVSGAVLLEAVASISRVPAAALRIVTGRFDVSPSNVLTSSADGQFPSASALLRLRGGKGGFGSLLRGAASKAGQKKTSNFDACRDINGRRLRHVNAERRLEEWKAEAGDRHLEKLAENFIKKKAKEAGRRGGPSAAEVDKYLEKYRKDAEICVNAVEESVRASLGKRKTAPKPPSGADAKKLKIWLGKNKVEEDESDSDSDSDMDDEDSEDQESADAKSLVVDEGNCSNGSIKNEKLDLGSVSGSHSEGESSGEKSQPTTKSGAEGGDFESDGSAEPELGMVDHPIPEVLKSDEVTADEDNTTSATSNQNNPVVPQVKEALKADEDNSASATSNQNNPEVPKVEEYADASKSYSEPLDLAKYSSAVELEVLGLEKLKIELQSRGLKCGGTLQERATRLFLLKTTPLDKLPKKLLAKAAIGGK